MPERPAPQRAGSEHVKPEALVDCIHTLHAIADHALDVDCDRECVEWARDRAASALWNLLGDDWTYRDLERVVAEIRRVPA